MQDRKKGILHYKGFNRVQSKEKGLLSFRCRNVALEKALFLQDAGKRRMEMKHLENKVWTQKLSLYQTVALTDSIFSLFQQIF